MAQLLELDAVHARIGEYQILQGVSLAVPEHGVTVLLGRNGAGKTTTLRTVMGYVKAHSGTVRLRDKAISGLRPYQIARLGVSYLPEEGHVFGNLTIQENLWLSAKRDGQQAARIEQAVTVFPALQPAWKRHAATLSGGQKQMLAMASLLVAAQPVLLIDEPSKGLSPTVRIAASGCTGSRLPKGCGVTPQSTWRNGISKWRSMGCPGPLSHIGRAGVRPR